MRILITGGSGTFGKTASRVLLKAGHIVTVMSRDEQKQEIMAAELPDLRLFLGDVRDKDRLRLAMRGQNAVFHAAALKIVPKLEFDPIEAVKTNIYGSQNVIECALDLGTPKVLLISTDKATDPQNLYGATKKVAEHLFRAANALSHEGIPAFSVLRYGNVWGSRGSVIETWETAVRNGEQPKITDPRMTRFFITAGDAIQFARDSLDAMTGGELFVPRMRAYKLAALRTAFSAVYPDVTFENTGIRPGEKIHEALISSYELPHMIASGKFLRAGDQFAKEYGQVVSRWCSSDLAEEMSIAELRALIEQRKNYGAKK